MQPCYKASDTDGDYVTLSNLALVFLSGSSDGDTVCANITVASDLLVECEEVFTVELTLDTTKDNLNVGNNSTFVTLMDSESKNMEII